MRIHRNEKKLVYHYTHLIAGGTIIQDGYLRVSEFEKKQGMRAALWFSKHEIYEPSALKHYQDGNGIKSFQSIHEQRRNFNEAGIFRNEEACSRRSRESLRSRRVSCVFLHKRVSSQKE